MQITKGLRKFCGLVPTAGEPNWGKLDAAIAKVEQARASGLPITADMYTYIAGATGLDASMPPWVQEGGYKEWAKRLKDPAIRAKVKKTETEVADGRITPAVAAGQIAEMLK